MIRVGVESPMSLVCPECGQPAGSQPFCASCGRNLTHEERLPTLEEWEALQAISASINDEDRHQQDGRRRRLAVAGFALILAAAVIAVVVLILTSGSSGNTMTVRVPSPSMVPTLAVGAHVTVSKNPSYVPNVGDIVLAHAPTGADSPTPVCGDSNQGAGHPRACGVPAPGQSSLTLIKRVVAGPGDIVKIVNGHVYRNGALEQDSSYTEPCGNDSACNFPAPITIPGGDYFCSATTEEHQTTAGFGVRSPAPTSLAKSSGDSSMQSSGGLRGHRGRWARWVRKQAGHRHQDHHDHAEDRDNHNCEHASRGPRERDPGREAIGPVRTLLQRERRDELSGQRGQDSQWGDHCLARRLALSAWHCHRVGGANRDGPHGGSDPRSRTAELPEHGGRDAAATA